MRTAPDFHGRWLAAIDARRAGMTPDQALPGSAQAGFAVYANTGLLACANALEANFPAVAQRLGPKVFWPLAVHHARLYPAHDARLFLYGEGFVEFLRDSSLSVGGFELPELPVLRALAQLDRLWLQAHVAADAIPLDHQRWAAQAPATLVSAVLPLAPATRFWSHATLPIWQLWSTARAVHVHDSLAPQQGQAVLITRPGDAVLSCELSAAGCAFLQVCAQGLPLAHAASAALQQAPETDLQALLTLLFSQGAFAEHQPLHHPTAVPT